MTYQVYVPSPFLCYMLNAHVCYLEKVYGALYKIPSSARHIARVHMLSHKLIKCYFVSRRRTRSHVLLLIFMSLCESKARVLSTSLLLYIFDIIQTRLLNVYFSRLYRSEASERWKSCIFATCKVCASSRGFPLLAVNLSSRVKSAQLESHSKQMRLLRQTGNIVSSVCRSKLRDRAITDDRAATFSSLAAGQIRSLHSYRAYFLRAISLLGSMRNYEAIPCIQGLPGRCMYPTRPPLGTSRRCW